MSKLGLILLAVGLFVGGCVSKSGRLDVTINDGWRFIRQDVSGAERISFKDSSWKRVTLPHTWNNLDGQDGGNNYYRGPGWYRRRLTIPSAYSGKSIFLRFEGAALVSDVYVNGQNAGEHRGGFGAFCFDVSNLVHQGANTIAVRVDNSKFEDVSPLSGDFTIFGGLYRNVHLLVLNPLSVTPLDDASTGVYLTQTHVDRETASVQITAKLRNAFATDQTAAVSCQIVDADGKIVTQSVNETVVPSGGIADAVSQLTMGQPHLWNGVNDPYLYRAIVEVRRGSTVVDRVIQPLGLRFYAVDPDNGFTLNDHHYLLHGVNVHQDWPDKGWAIGQKEIDANYKLIAEMGCTAVRLAHYQHSDAEYSLCDKKGIVVWAELAMINRTHQTPAFEENVKQQLRELIKQNFNHPSICFWSMYNELNSSKSAEPGDLKLVGELNDLAHHLDGTRLTTAATDRDIDHPVNWIMDITGFNRYWGWYRGTLDDWGPFLDNLHATYPTRAVGISEYGAGASVQEHEVYPTTHPATTGFWHPEEWQAIVHEKAYAAMKDRHWLWGTFAWCMFDFASDGRREGDRPGMNDKGLVTADRKTRKDAFYYYKACWSDSPFVYITSRRFDPRPPGATTLKVYSNCDFVELFLNGRSLGGRSGIDHVFIWPNVQLTDGKANVRAVGDHAGSQSKDGCTWTVSSPQPATAPAKSFQPLHGLFNMFHKIVHH